MSLFEKIEMDPMENEMAPPERSSRTWKDDDILTVRYALWPKLLLLVLCLAFVPVLPLLLQEGSFFIELLCVGSAFVCFSILAHWLLTLEVSFYPDRIVRRTVFGKLAIPASSMYVHVKEQDLHFFHVSRQNLPESIRISRSLISRAEFAAIHGYLQDVYRIDVHKLRQDGLTDRAHNKLATDEYLKAAESYSAMGFFFVIFVVIAFFTVGLSEAFFGLAPSLPAFPIRLGFIGIAIAAFFLLRHSAVILTGTSQLATVPVMSRLERARNYAVNSAAVTVAVGALGLLLFLLFGNTLDLYIFLLIGFLYFQDCYPRLSTWERLSLGSAQPETPAVESSPLPRRSLQVSLVLMGALAAMSYGENGHFLYENRKDCQDDWGDGSCQELPADSGYTGSGGSGGVRYYGPRYGTGYGKPRHAVGLGPIKRGGFGSLGSFHASFGG